MASRYAKERQDNRIKDYKSAFNAEDHRKRREESIISIRKQKREENIMKKRNMEIIEEEIKSPSDVLLSHLSQYCENIKQTEDIQKQIEGTIAIRKLLSIETNPPIDNIIESGIVEYLIKLLGRGEVPKLQFEAAWALTNIASGTTQQTLYLLQHGAVQAFVEQLNAGDVGVREQAVWALGNIAGDSHQFRDHVLNHNALPRLLALTGEENKPSLRRNAVWTISNLCRGKPAPHFHLVRPAIPILASLLHCPDTQILSDTCWALSYLSDGDNLKIKAVLDSKICSSIVSFLSHKSSSIHTPALRIIGNIVTGDDLQTQAAIHCGALPVLKGMLDDPTLKKTLKKDVCWTLSNICAGHPSQIQSVIDAGLFPSLIDHILHADFEVKKEAVWAIANATSYASPLQIAYLVQVGSLKALCHLLSSSDSKVVAVSLEGLENILQHGKGEGEGGEGGGEGVNPYADLLEDLGGVSLIEKLQLHINQTIFDKATSIIEKYFSSISDDDDDDDDNSLAPSSSDPSSFSFGALHPPRPFHFN